VYLLRYETEKKRLEAEGAKMRRASLEAHGSWDQPLKNR